MAAKINLLPKIILLWFCFGFVLTYKSWPSDFDSGTRHMNGYERNGVTRGISVESSNDGTRRGSAYGGNDGRRGSNSRTTYSFFDRNNGRTRGSTGGTRGVSPDSNDGGTRRGGIAYGNSGGSRHTSGGSNGAKRGGNNGVRNGGSTTASGNSCPRNSGSSGRCEVLELPEEPWSYEGRSNGACRWGELFPNCNQNMQSPIDIDTKESKSNSRSISLNMKNYGRPISQATMENDGHTVVITPEDSIRRTIDVNGREYLLQQLHFHWSKDISEGSEHAVDGKKYALEAHFVHRSDRNQTAVVGVLYDVSSTVNMAFDIITANLKGVTYRDERTQIRRKLNLMELLPQNQETFYRYYGSLTTPPCDQGVAWSVFKDIAYVGKRQLTNFFNLYAVRRSEANNKECRITENVRPLQPFNNREIVLAKS